MQFFLLPQNVLAEEKPLTMPIEQELSITKLLVTPSIFEEVLKPGQNITRYFEFTNNSLVPVPIKAYVRTFDASNETGGVSISEDPDNQRLSLTSWISVQQPDFIIQPGQTKKVAVNLNPPADLPPGGYYGVIFFEPLLPESFLSQNSLQIGGRIGALMFLVGQGDIKESGKIETLSSPFYHWKVNNNQITLRFKNTGNVHLRPKTKISIVNYLSNKKIIQQTEFTVLPQKIRQQIFNSKDIITPGIYKAQFEVSYGRENTKIIKELQFIYFPLIYIAILILFMLLILILATKKGRTRVTRVANILFHGK